MSTRTESTAAEPLTPGLLRRVAAARFCSVGASTWDRWTAAGLNPAPVKIGGAVAWCRDELTEWMRHGCPERRAWGPVWVGLRNGRRR